MQQILSISLEQNSFRIKFIQKAETLERVKLLWHLLDQKYQQEPLEMSWQLAKKVQQYWAQQPRKTRKQFTNGNKYAN